MPQGPGRWRFPPGVLLPRDRGHDVDDEVFHGVVEEAFPALVSKNGEETTGEVPGDRSSPALVIGSRRGGIFFSLLDVLPAAPTDPDGAVGVVISPHGGELDVDPGSGFLFHVETLDEVPAHGTTG